MKGHELINQEKKKFFGADQDLMEWINLLETLLMWERWFRSAKVKKSHLKCVVRKHQRIMYILKKVYQRVDGMGFKIVKFHAILHLVTSKAQMRVVTNLLLSLTPNMPKRTHKDLTKTSYNVGWNVFC